MDLFLVFDSKFFSVRLSFDNDLVTRVCQAIKNRVGNNGIRKELLPIGHRSIGSENDGLAFEPRINERIETLGRLLIDGLEGKVIDDQQISFEETLQKYMKSILQIGRCQFAKQLMEAVVADGESCDKLDVRELSRDVSCRFPWDQGRKYLPHVL